MRTLFLAALFFSSLAVAAPEDRRFGDMDYCMSVGDIYEAAANARDYGSSPQEALQRVQSWPVPSLDTKKFIINRVYFQDPFTFGRPEVLKMASIRYCYKPSQQFEPLK